MPDEENRNRYEEMLIDGTTFCKVGRSDEIFEGKGLQVKFSDDYDHQVAVIRFEGKLYCLDNICPHRHADSIYEGIINKSKATVTCPLHGWTYQLKNGKNINTRQGIKSLSTYKIFEKDGHVFVEKPELSIPKWRKSE